MLNRFTDSQRRLITKAFAVLILPVPIVFSVAYQVNLKAINNNLETIGTSYVKRIEHLIDDLKENNYQALYRTNNCAQIQNNFLFESNLREMLIVENQTITCSSKRGVRHTDISHRVSASGLNAREFLFDLDGDPDNRTLIVVDVDKNNPQRGAVSIMDRHYVSARLGHGSDKRIKKIVVKLGELYYPENKKFVSQNPSQIVKSSRYDFSLMVEASSDFVDSRVIFSFLSAIPVSLAISILIFIFFQWFSKRNSLVDDLKRALTNKELFLMYQPIISSDDHSIIGAEALIRWVHPSLGFIRPDTFIPLAEEHGLINQITDYVIEHAFEDWKMITIQDKFHLGVNVPPSYLLNDLCLQRLEQYGRAFKDININFDIEITERQLLNEQGQKAIEEVRTLGIQVFIDDFGTGHTTLSVLQNITFDCLKIDKCFVDTIGLQSVNAPVLNAIIDLAHSLNIAIIAEGVETEEQARYLAAKGVQFQQGYYFHRPLMLADIHLKMDQ